LEDADIFRWPPHPQIPRGPLQPQHSAQERRGRVCQHIIITLGLFFFIIIYFWGAFFFSLLAQVRRGDWSVHGRVYAGSATRGAQNEPSGPRDQHAALAAHREHQKKKKKKKKAREEKFNPLWS
jgi:hypothetical protein